MQFHLLSWALDQAGPRNRVGGEGEAVSPVSTLHLPGRSLTLSFLRSLNLSTEAAGSERPAPPAWWAAVLARGRFSVVIRGLIPLP